MKSRKRSRSIQLVLLGTASLIVGGCGGCDENQKAGGVPMPKIDPQLAKQAVAAGTSAVVSDAFLQGLGAIASSPVAGSTAPLDVVRLGMAIDQADETVAVTSHESGIQRTGQQGQSTRHVHHYHSSPGIGWFLWGHMLGSSTARAGQPYVPPARYGATPRTFTPPSSGRSFAGGSSGSSGSRSGSPSTGGSVSRGGFGSSGSAHASGGSS